MLTIDYVSHTAALLSSRQNCEAAYNSPSAVETYVSLLGSPSFLRAMLIRSAQRRDGK